MQQIMKLTFKEVDKMYVWNRLFSNLHYSDKVNFYLLGGYHEFNIDMQKWEKVYNELSNDHFFIKLDNHFLYNNLLVCDVFNEFQICNLLINEIKDLNKEYDFTFLRLHLKDMRDYFNGYVIEELTDDYIILNWGGAVQDKANIIDEELKKYISI